MQLNIEDINVDDIICAAYDESGEAVKAVFVKKQMPKIKETE